MTNQRPSSYDGERLQTRELAPENQNAEERDSNAQSQTVFEEARDHSIGAFGLEDSEKSGSGLDDADVQDLVDHMTQMHRSGSIDMSAYAGEPNHDDNVDKYGKRSKLDDLSGNST